MISLSVFKLMALYGRLKYIESSLCFISIYYQELIRACNNDILTRVKYFVIFNYYQPYTLG
jgi:hypothetical protein